MTPEVLVVGLLIMFARIADVSLGTVRTLAIVQGRANVAWVLGFSEVLIWLFAVSHVIRHLESPVYAICYALGYATGNYVGVKIESWLAFGEQVVRVFTRAKGGVSDALRDEGFRVTSFEGRGRGGPVELVFIETKRRETPRLLKEVARLDPECFYLVNDIRMAAYPAMVQPAPSGWRAILKRK